MTLKLMSVKSMLEVENAYELLTVFQMFCYLNGRFPLTNGLLIVPNGEVPEGKKINLNNCTRYLKTRILMDQLVFSFCVH